MNRRSIPLIIATFLCTFHLQAQQPWETCRFNERKLKELVGTLTPFPTWINESDCFYYNIYGSDGEPEYLLVDARRGIKEPLVNKKRLVEQLNRLENSSHSPSKYRLRNITFIGKGVRNLYFMENGKWYCYDRKTERLKQTTSPLKTNRRKPSPQEYALYQKLSPNEEYLAYGVGHNLVVDDREKELTRLLTRDGVYRFSYNSYHREIPEKKNCSTLAQWVPGTSILLSLRQDTRRIKEMSITESLTKGRPLTTNYQMEIPGDETVKQYEMKLFNAANGKSVRVPIERFKDQEVTLRRISRKGIYFTRTARTMDTLELCKVNPQSGEIRTLIREVSRPHINNILWNMCFIHRGKQIIWWSERTGRGNYYLYNDEGRLLGRITQGDHLVAGRIQRIDTINNQIIFAGYGNEKGVNPQYRYYYVASLDGRKQRLLTPGEGEHDITISKNGNYLIDTYSRVDQPPISQVVAINTTQKPFIYHKTDISPLLSYGWKLPTRIQVTAADGSTPLYGVMYCPTQMEKGKKYPIITNVYPGPQSDQIPISFDLDDNGNQDLAELGFIVVNIGPRGSSPLRGRDFYCFSYGNLRDYPLEDDKCALEQLAAQYPFIDLRRVGIYGHSGGAFMTVSAMLQSPDFYKVAVAASGNYDNNIYTRDWGELYQGGKFVYKEGKYYFQCKCPTPMELAQNLRGKLLLISGDVDKNVNIASTYRMANAFIKAGKMIDMMILPGKDHAVACPYYYRLIRKYFYENLK